MAFSLTKDPEKLKEFKNKEMTRILSIPVNKPLTEQLHSKFSKATLLPSAEIPSLLPPQSESLVAYLTIGGLFAYVGVGKGKSLISIACASSAYRKGLRKIILVIPPKLAQQTEHKVLPWLRRQLAVNMPVHIIAGKNKAGRIKASLQDSGLFIMAHSQLSVNDADELINNIAPELIIVDEAHKLGNKHAVCTKRVNRWMINSPETEFVALSGTMGKKSLMDYYHIMRWCLKDKCPLPSTEYEAVTWASVVDTTFNEYTPDGTLEPLRNWANRTSEEKFERTVAGYRKSLNYRLATTRGVVFAVNDDLGTSILFSNEPVEVPDNYEGMPELVELRRKLHHEDKSPDGDVIDFAIHKFRYDFELSAGFYNSLTWPEEDKLMDRLKVSRSEATSLLVRSKDYHRATQEYHKMVRDWLKDHADIGLDTPMLLGNSMHHHKWEQVGKELYECWAFRKSLDFEGRLERDSKAVRVCDYKIKALVRWAKSLPKKEGALVWWQRKEIGLWAYEYLREAGLNVVFADATPQGSSAINNESNKDKIILASVTAYKEGIDWMQKHIQHIYFLQFPREAHFAEQAIGRNHRTGCVFDELTYTTNFTLDFDHNMFSAVLSDALFQHQTGTPHKLIYGAYDPVPRIVPTTVLTEQGIISKGSRHAEAELRRIFS